MEIELRVELNDLNILKRKKNNKYIEHVARLHTSPVSHPLNKLNKMAHNQIIITNTLPHNTYNSSKITEKSAS